MRYQISELESNCKAADAGLRKSAAEILKMDDRLLAGLQKLANELEPGQPEDEDIGERVRDMCARHVRLYILGCTNANDS